MARYIRWAGKRRRVFRGPAKIFNPPGYRGKLDMSGGDFFHAPQAPKVKRSRRKRVL